ncbi:MAG: Fe-S protein assembly co-chaperone HscB [Magnetococcus sp. DMHC-1]|nr:Fe-S protein assembly co-chaperone HscB [Magnetococcales bacterium]
MDYFALFGMPPAFQVDRNQLDTVYREKQQLFHPDRFALRSIQERRYSLEQVTQLNEAWRTLRDPLQRGEYLLRLLEGGDLSPSPAGNEENMAGDPEFLLEVMEMREALAMITPSHATASQQLAALRQDVEQRIAAEISAVNDALTAAWAESSASSAREHAKRHIKRLRYHKRFVEELDRLEE